MIYLQLFLSFLQIGALSFGGGYAAMPLIQAQIVTNHGWLSMSEFTDLVTIAEMTPGPIAVNSATFVGTKIGGVLGALVATAGCILPACILVTLIARLYLKYRNLAVLQSVLGISAACRGGHDCLCRDPHPHQRLLGRHGGSGHDKLADGGDFPGGLCAAAENKNEPHCRYGPGGNGEFGFSAD